MIRARNNFIFGLMLVSYVILIWNLMRLTNEIKEAGDSIRIAPLLISTKMLSGIAVIAVAAGCAISYSFYDVYPMEWREPEVVSSDEVQTVKSQLLELGFPEDVLKDLSEEDILVCKDAKRVIVKDGSEENENLTQKIPGEFTPVNIVVELAGQENHYKIFYYFKWQWNTAFYGTECVVIWPVTKGYQDDWEISEAFTGRLLYEKVGKTQTASYAKIEEVNIAFPQTVNMTDDTEIIAEFSYPSGGTNCRGYITYSAVAEESWNMVLNSRISYVHQKQQILYPAKTAADYWLYREGSTDEFEVIQTSLHFRLNEKE